MGREVRRVPLDFAWPIGKTWEGFLNPHYKPCPAAATGECHSGYSSAGKWLDSISRLITILGEEAVSEPHAVQLRQRGRTFPHPYLTEWPQAPHAHEPPYRLLGLGGEETIALVRGLAQGMKVEPFGGSTMAWKIGDTLRKAAGITDEKWGTCKVCDGDGSDPATKEVYENWQEEPPPTGDAWQMWETTSEGSPISPPKATPEALARWLADNKASSFGSSGASYESWLRMITGSGHAVSAVIADGVFMSGVEAAGLTKGPAR